MRRLLTTGLLLSAMTAFAQTRPPTTPETPAPSPDSTSTELPDAPATARKPDRNVVAVAEASFKATGDGSSDSCGLFSAMKVVYFDPKPLRSGAQALHRTLLPLPAFPHHQRRHPHDLAAEGLSGPPRPHRSRQLRHHPRHLRHHHRRRLTHRLRPGLKGFGKNVGVSLLQDATGQFFGAFAIPSLVHQDPHYHRMPHAPFTKAPRPLHLPHRHLSAATAATTCPTTPRS